MDNETRIKIVIAYADITQAELANRLGVSPSSLNQKIKRNTLSLTDMENIGKALNIEWMAGFVIDGKVI